MDEPTPEVLQRAAVLRRTEAADIVLALRRNEQSVTDAARELGMSRNALYIRFNRTPEIREQAEAS